MIRGLVAHKENDRQVVCVIEGTKILEAVFFCLV
jgi:hypothetical protein